MIHPKDRKKYIINFFNVVRQMRKCQNDYFDTRTKTALEASKRAENLCDKMLQEIFSNQLSIFDQKTTKKDDSGA